MHESLDIFQHAGYLFSVVQSNPQPKTIMSCGPIPPAAATAQGMGTNAPASNADAEKQMSQPSSGSAPSTVSTSNENSAAEQQLAQPKAS